MCPGPSPLKRRVFPGTGRGVGGQPSAPVHRSPSDSLAAPGRPRRPGAAPRPSPGDRAPRGGQSYRPNQAAAPGSGPSIQAPPHVAPATRRRRTGVRTGGPGGAGGQAGEVGHTPRAAGPPAAALRPTSRRVVSTTHLRLRLRACGLQRRPRVTGWEDGRQLGGTEGRPGRWCAAGRAPKEAATDPGPVAWPAARGAGTCHPAQGPACKHAPGRVRRASWPLAWALLHERTPGSVQPPRRPTAPATRQRRTPTRLCCQRPGVFQAQQAGVAVPGPHQVVEVDAHAAREPARPAWPCCACATRANTTAWCQAHSSSLATCQGEGHPFLGAPPEEAGP